MEKGTALTDFGDRQTIISLETALERWSGHDPLRAAAAKAISAIAQATIDLETDIAKGVLGSSMADGNGDNDRQTSLDTIADHMLTAALSSAPVAVIGSQQRHEPTILDHDAPIVVTIDPLDGSSNVDTNISVGTIFSVLPAIDDVRSSLLQPGHCQLAAGFVIYGPKTCLVLTLGDGTDIYTLDRVDRGFLRTRSAVQIPPQSNEYAINASNYRHWDAPIRTYIDDNVAGIDGPTGVNFNMRWIASLVAEAYRILVRGGIFLYPGDRREGFEKGRLRLVYEANPLAMIIEQAGGLATDGEDRILDIEPISLHQPVPLVFGSANKVDRVKAFHNGTLPIGERSPLFGRRGLFRH